MISFAENKENSLNFVKLLNLHLSIDLIISAIRKEYLRSSSIKAFVLNVVIDGLLNG